MPAFEYDLFISHAFEDKPFVDQVAKDLLEREVKVWYSGFELKAGDSIFDSIQDGLRQSAMGMVVLSPTYFGKEYARREMKALFNQEIGDGGKKIIPLWYETDYRSVIQHEPLLADKLGINASIGLEQISMKVIEALNHTPIVSRPTPLSGAKNHAIKAILDTPAYGDLKTEISQNRIEPVIQKLIAITLGDSYHHNDAILLSGQHAALKQKFNLLSNDEYSRGEARIRYSIVQFISTLESQQH